MGSCGFLHCRCRTRIETSWSRGCVRARSMLGMRSGRGSCCWRRMASRTGRSASIVGMHYNQVAVWRRRYGEFGLDGLDDEPRPGRPPVYDHDDVILLVKTVTETPPDPATRWTMDMLAARDGRTRGADLGVAGVADLQSAGSQAVADRELDDQPRSRLLGQSRRRLRPVSEPAGERGGVVGRREVPDPSQEPGHARPTRRFPATATRRGLRLPCVTAPRCCSPG